MGRLAFDITLRTITMDDFDKILAEGINFKPAPKNRPDTDKVKTKAKKKKYVTGAHGSGSAKQKAKYREQRANRKSQRRNK
jgi:hypothetical protein